MSQRRGIRPLRRARRRLGPRPSAEGGRGVGHEPHGVGTGRAHPPVVLGRRVAREPLEVPDDVGLVVVAAVGGELAPRRDTGQRACDRSGDGTARAPRTAWGSSPVARLNRATNAGCRSPASAASSPIGSEGSASSRAIASRTAASGPGLDRSRAVSAASIASSTVSPAASGPSAAGPSNHGCEVTPLASARGSRPSSGSPSAPHHGARVHDGIGRLAHHESRPQPRAEGGPEARATRHPLHRAPGTAAATG